MTTPFISTTELSEAMAGASVATARGTAVITAACDLVRLFTEQEISPVVNGGTVVLDGTGTDALLLPQLPVLNAGTVIETGGGGTLTYGTDYKLNGNGVLLRSPTVTDEGSYLTNWFKGRQNVTVVYSYGYSSVPADLKEVAIQMAARLHQHSGVAVSEESLGAYSVRYSNTATATDFSKTEQMVLRRYKQAR